LFPERRGEVFRLNRNERSHWSGNGVHVESELVFMIGRNMHFITGGMDDFVNAAPLWSWQRW
ncbi:hypothetical protein ACSZNE_16605, partial [Aeromonas caviae]|uniref:hypothetical protein n=1 Tax=Aeromonas caviae TaxID=648 RepID=UPI003EC7B587